MNNPAENGNHTASGQPQHTRPNQHQMFGHFQRATYSQQPASFPQNQGRLGYNKDNTPNEDGDNQHSVYGTQQPFTHNEPYSQTPDGGNALPGGNGNDQNDQ